MTRDVPVSFEYDDRGNLPGATMRQTLETRVAKAGAIEFLETAYEKLYHLDAYSHLEDVKMLIDAAYNPGDKTGQLFLDGAVLALDWVDTYAPSLMPRMHDAMEPTIRIMRTHIVSDPYTDEDRLSLATSLRQFGNEDREELSRDYAGAIEQIVAYRGFPPSDTTRNFVVTEGIGYVMASASYAYDRDMAEFQRAVTVEITPVEKNRVVRVPDSLLREIVAELRGKSGPAQHAA